jgi:hypothetical protein
MDTNVLNKINNKKFKSGIEYQKQLLQITRSIQDMLLQGLPSNYSKDHNTNLAEFFRAVSKEFARLQTSSSDVNEDKYNDETRVEYLYQILGDSLFLGEKAINENLNDAAYRDFLLKVRNAYYEGSRKQNLEDAVSDIIGLPVTIKELYLDLRKKNSFYGLKDTHKMFFDILMDDVTAASSIGLILEDIKFFIDLIKPAHTIYDTRLIWTDSLTNRDGECKPSYIKEDMDYVIYGTSRIYQVTYLASKIYKFSGTDPAETWVEGTIQTIDLNKGIFYLTDNRILVYNADTLLYLRDGTGDHEILPETFSVGDVIKYYATKDAAASSKIIDSTWGYTGIIDDFYLSENLITLTDGSGIIFNNDTLAYTRDYNGEYRIEVEDLTSNREIAYKAEKNTQSYKFYRKPAAVQSNFFKQFDSAVIEKPSFQDYVEKNKEIPPGTHEGYDVYVIDGVATIKNISTMFYKRDDSKSNKEIEINKYTLYIDDELQKQFEMDDAPRTLTQDEAKNVFITAYGYTGLQEPDVNYRIDITTTGELIQDGPSSTVQTIGDHTEMCDRKAACQLVPLYEDTRKYFAWPDLQLTSGFFDISFGFTGGVGIEDTIDDTLPITEDVVDEDVDTIEDIVEYGMGSGDDAYDVPGAYYTFTGISELSSSTIYFGPNPLNVPTWHYISSDPNLYQMPYLPMLGADGLPAEASDVTVYVSGKKVDDAISSIDPWNGIVSLNFIPPYDTKLRIDYYYSKRYPDPVYYLKQVISKTIQAAPNNIAGIFNVINPGGLVSHLTWPFAVTDPALYGDDQDYQMNKFPMLNNKGELVTKEEISVFVGSAIVSGTIKVTETDKTGSTLKNMSGEDWTPVIDGDVIIIQAENYLDNTLIYVIESVDAVDGTLRLPNSLPVLDASYPYIIIRFIEVLDAVDAVRPLLGHVRLNFIPPVNSYIRVNYYYTPYERDYLMMPDAPVTGLTPGVDYGASSYTPDTFYGSKNNYTMSVDASPDLMDVPYWSFDELLKVGYRYRAFDLAHSAALDSEQLRLDDYVAHKNRASFNNRPGLLDRYDLMFSPEFLTDKDKNVILNDKYLQKDLPAVTVLNPGTPVFEKSFTDDAHHTNALYPDSVDTYDPGLVGGMDLRAGFTIIDPDDSGIIDYNPVCQILDNRQINLYSDFKQVEYPNGGFDAPLSTIDEGGTSIPFKTTFIDQYYPNRELRLTDYLDYINQVPTEYRFGSLRVLNGSTIVKNVISETGLKTFKALNVGDMVTVKDIPYEEETGYTGYVGYSKAQDLLGYVMEYSLGYGETGLGETGFNVRRYKDLDHTLVDIIDFETAQISPIFKGPGGTYDYELTRSKTYAVDVSLFGGYGETAPEFMVGNLNRTLVLNGLLGYTYSLPASILQHLPGYGDTGTNFELHFPDPDPDPYPANPDNPWIPNPTGISYFDMGYQIEYRFTGSITGGYTGVYSVRSNRINATTGLVRTSQIIDEEGNSYGYTGLLSGFTGPSGALDLGITGPVGDVNPRILKPSDSYVIPSGDTGIFMSYSESEYRVQWRNWDQDMIIVGLGTTGSVMIEDPVNLMDDIGDGIKRSFWSVSGAVLREMRFQGTVIETTEKIYDSVLASSYPNGLILLTQDQVDLINAGHPLAHLNDVSYQLNRRIVRELLHDGSIKVTEIQEFISI